MAVNVEMHAKAVGWAIESNVFGFTNERSLVIEPNNFSVLAARTIKTAVCVIKPIVREVRPKL